MLSLANDVDVDTGGSFDAFLVQGPREGEIPRVRRESNRAIVLLKSKLDVAFRTRIPDHAQEAHGVADPEILAHEEMGGRDTVFQKASCISNYWNQARCELKFMIGFE